MEFKESKFRSLLFKLDWEPEPLEHQFFVSHIKTVPLTLMWFLWQYLIMVNERTSLSKGNCNCLFLVSHGRRVTLTHPSGNLSPNGMIIRILRNLLLTLHACNANCRIYLTIIISYSSLRHKFSRYPTLSFIMSHLYKSKQANNCYLYAYSSTNYNAISLYKVCLDKQCIMKYWQIQMLANRTQTKVQKHSLLKKHRASVSNEQSVPVISFYKT